MAAARPRHLRTAALDLRRRVVLSNDVKGATVHYTCPANGFGRTSVRVETPRLAKIDTQGIMGNAPFAYRAEARKVGACSGGGRVGSARRLGVV